MSATADSPLGVVAIGAGMASAPHLRALTEIDDASLRGATLHWIVTGDATRAAAASALAPSVRVTASLDEALADPDVDVALILTPSSSHLEVISAAASAGKAVIVEKPIEVTVARARQAIEVCAKAGVPLAVVHQHRFRTIVPRLKAILDEGRLGRLHSIEVRVPWWRAQAYYDEPGRGTYARDGGGALITQAIHVLDLALYLCGPISAVCARTMTSPSHDMEAEDLAVAVTEWQCGAIGTILASTAHRPGFNDTILISGRDGTALLEGEDLTLWEGQGSAKKYGTHAAAVPPGHPMDFSHHDHRRLLAATLAAIGQGVAPPVSGLEACRVLELIDAITESARLKQWVEVRSETTSTETISTETTSKGGKRWMLSA